MRIPTLEEIDRELLRRKLEGNFFEFVLWVFEEIYRRPFYVNWHHRMLCRIMEQVYAGEILNLIVNIPPRYTKTEIVMRLFPAWSFAKNGKCQFMHLSYSDALALETSSKVKEIISHEAFKKLWPHTISDDVQSKKKWLTEEDGSFSATAAGGAVTGFGAGVVNATEFSGAILIDDPMKPDDAKYPVKRNFINERFEETIFSRRNDRKTPIVLVMQRLHEDDPSGYLLAGNTSLKFKLIKLPAINVDGPNEYDPREVGEALWPQKHTTEELLAIKEAHPKVFAGQYQGDPAPEEGNIFKEEFFQYYDTLPDSIGRIVTSTDTGGKEGVSNDFTTITVWGEDSFTKDLYLIDRFHKSINYLELVKVFKAIAKRYPTTTAHLVEEKQLGMALIQTLRKEMRGIVSINPVDSKVQRAEATLGLWESGKVFLPKRSWVNEYTTEMKLFPNAAHDDYVDSTSQALNWFRTHTYSITVQNIPKRLSKNILDK